MCLLLSIGPDGKRRTWTGYAKTELRIVGKKPTVAEFLTTWLDKRVNDVRRLKTYESYKYLADTHLT